VLVEPYIRIADRNRQKYFYEKPGVKRRRKRHLLAKGARMHQIRQGGFTQKKVP
jgi:hypothetical protein